MTSKQDLWIALKLYWRIIFTIVFPLILLPVFLVENSACNRCIYLMTVMVGFWITQVFPLPITGLIPVAFFPLMGILSTSETVSFYFTDVTMIFFGSYMMGIALEASKLNIRISLHILKIVGPTPRRLHIVFCWLGMVMSMLFPISFTTALLIPIVSATIEENETNGIGKFYTSGSREEDFESNEEPKRIPSKSTMGFFLSIAFSTTIGASGFVTGSGSHIEFLGIYEGIFPNLAIDSGHWISICFPHIIITTGLSIVWIQFLHFGLFRPKSSAALEILVTPEKKLIAKTKILDKLNALELISFHEIAVAVCCSISAVLWIFRMPQFFPGWAGLWITSGGLVIKESTVAVLIIIIMFFVPRTPACFYAFSSDEDKKPTGPSIGLLAWKYAIQKIPWPVVFMIGAGFSMAEGADKSGCSEKIIRLVEALETHPPFGIAALAAMIAACITQFTNNLRAIRIVMPMLANVAQAADIHPHYVMFPACIASTFGFILQVSTPPNAFVSLFLNMRTIEIMKAGIVVLIISYLVLLAICASIIPIFHDVAKFPEHAYMP